MNKTKLLNMPLTPSFWGTVLGILLACLGHPTAGAALLLVVGWGGVGIALHLGTEEDRDPWRVDTVLVTVLEALRGRHLDTTMGLATHLPQAVMGLLILGGVV